MAARSYLEIGVFDPEDPLRYEAGAELKASYDFGPGLVLSARVRQRAFGSLKQRGPGIPGERGEHFTPEQYLSDPANEYVNGVPRVRSDTRMYTGNHSPTVPELTLGWYAQPSASVYSRVTVGLLERAYGGVSGELLWKPADSPLGVGVEIDRVRKRDFEDAFEFRDYEVTTGFVSLYYEFAQGYTAQLDLGKYLAGDKGATVSVTPRIRQWLACRRLCDQDRPQRGGVRRGLVRQGHHRFDPDWLGRWHAHA